MKLTGMLHRFEDRAETWLSVPGRTRRIRLYLDFTCNYSIALLGIYVAFLLVVGIIRALAS